MRYFFIAVYLIEYNIFAPYFVFPCYITLKSYQIEITDQPLCSVKPVERKKSQKKNCSQYERLSPSVIEGFKAAIKGVVVYKDISKAFPIKRSLPHGHIACILGLIKN